MLTQIRLMTGPPEDIDPSDELSQLTPEEAAQRFVQGRIKGRRGFVSVLVTDDKQVRHPFVFDLSKLTTS